jgi:S1-C subfamily serine protease
LLISRTTKGGNAEKAGIMQGTQAARYGSSIIYLGGDIITEIDNIAISSIADYYSSLENKRPGDEISIKLHRNGKDRIIKLILADPTPTAPRKRPERIRTYGI